MELVFTPLGKNVNLIKHFLNKTKINFCDISDKIEYIKNKLKWLIFDIQHDFFYIIFGSSRTPNPTLPYPNIAR